MSQFKDLTNGIAFYEKVCKIADHFEEEKAALIMNLKKLSEQIFRADNMIISCTSRKEGLEELEKLIRELKNGIYQGTADHTSCILHCEKKNEGFQTASKVQYVARTGNFYGGRSWITPERCRF